MCQTPRCSKAFLSSLIFYNPLKILLALAIRPSDKKKFLKTLEKINPIIIIDFSNF